MKDNNDRAKRAIARTVGTYDQPQDEEHFSPSEIDRMHDALRRLSRREWAIILAVRVEGLSYAELARRTGLSVADVERRFIQAFSNLCRNMTDPWRHWWRSWL